MHFRIKSQPFSPKSKIICDESKNENTVLRVQLKAAICFVSTRFQVTDWQMSLEITLSLFTQMVQENAVPVFSRVLLPIATKTCQTQSSHQILFSQ